MRADPTGMEIERAAERLPRGLTAVEDRPKSGAIF